MSEDGGIPRWDPSVVDELAERYQLANPNDAVTVAVTTMKEVMGTMSDYIKVLQGQNSALAQLLVTENDGLRKLRENEQKAHLEAMLATQEALDLSAERKMALLSQEGSEIRKATAVEWLTKVVGPKLLEQIQNSGASAKIVELARSLNTDQIEALRLVVSAEQFAAIEQLRKQATAESQEASDEQRTEPKPEST